MPYVSVSDFKAGMDRRRPRSAGVAGTLWTLSNGHFTRGGDIERRKAFVPVYTLPAGTVGLAQIDGQLCVFGNADLAASVPAAIRYIRTVTPSDIKEILGYGVFDRKVFFNARLADGAIVTSYDGALIDLAAANTANSNADTLTSYTAERLAAQGGVRAIPGGGSILVTAKVPGVDYALAVGSPDPLYPITATILVTNQAPLAETRATLTITITGGAELAGVNYIEGVTVGGTTISSEHIEWATSNSAVAAALKNSIIAGTATHGYSAIVAGNVVTVLAPVGHGATANGRVAVVNNAGALTVSVSGAMAGGITSAVARAKVVKITYGATYSPGTTYFATLDAYSFAVSGVASGAPAAVLPYKNRVWTAAGTLLRYSKLNTPTDLTSVDAGFINVSSETGGADRIQGLVPYGAQVAIFTRRSVHMWKLDTSPANNERLRTLDNTGTMAPRSIAQYGSEDVFYLSDAGVRSIRARDLTGAAYVGDIGTPLDPFIQEDMRAATPDELRLAVSLIDPVDGRYWLAVGDRIYVLTYFPSSNITAWSYYEPGFPVHDAVRCDDRVYLRSGNTIYAYGGEAGDTYPAQGEAPVVVELPFMTANAPAAEKRMYGIDLTASNTWRVQAYPDPNNLAAVIDLGRVTGVTAMREHIATVGATSHFALRLECDRAGPATLSGLQVHYHVADAR